ncbi:MAG: EamA family transporter [Lentisphaeria bacterium]|nr:EamA family transporter [Lentisphaeria bacterium]
MTGILLGGAAALCLAIAYVFSSMAVRRHLHIGPVGLLCRAHLLMGGLSGIGLCFTWSPLVLKHAATIAWPLLGGVLFYLMGQTCLFMAQRKVDSSRVVPLLGLKLIVLAVINILILKNAAYGLPQWLGIALTLASTALLHHAGRRIAADSFFWVVFTCIGYASSDTCITELVRRLQEAGVTGLAPASMLGAFLSYALCGALSLAALPWIPRQPAAVWRAVAPFAFFWLLAMLFLFACFSSIGTVNGNIIQSSRGLIAILLGAILAKAGFTELEERVSRAILLRRLLATVMMIAAIVSFNSR